MATKQPADKSHFILPDLGEGVHEAELIKWKVSPGDRVDEHQTLAEMETDKALVEVPSPWAGVIKDLNGNEGDIINVGSILVTYDVGGASSSADAGAQAASAGGDAASGGGTATATATDEAEREDAGTVVGSVDGSLSVSAAFSRRRDPAESPAARGGRAMATPAVRRVAREFGVDINRIAGTGRGGRVTASDVEAFAGGAAAPAARAPQAGPTAAPAGGIPAPPAPVTFAAGTSQRIPFRGVRRKIAEALHRSVQTTVHFTVVDEADVSRLDAKRKEYAAVLGHKISFLPFVMAAVVQGLHRHPDLNANVDDDKGEIIRFGDVHLGCAVDTDHGLMVPVIRNAGRMNVGELSQQVKSLADGCRDRSIEREKLAGGTFTISNVGSYGGLFATPIINYPEVAILAAGRVREQMVVREGGFHVGKVMPLSLSCDHRVVDGAEGARFLNTVVGLLQDPTALLGG